MTPTYEELKAENERCEQRAKAIDTMLGEEIERANKAEAQNLSLVAALKEIRERNPSYEDNSGNFANWEIANKALALSPEDSREALKEKLTKFIESQKDLPPDFAKIINEKFWELF